MINILFLGIPLSPLDAKLVEIRSYHINWESYHQNEVISAGDHEFISSFDQPSSKVKNTMLTEDPEKVNDPNLYIIFYCVCL